MKEPFRTIYFTLIFKGHQVGKWSYGVKISNTQDAIYIGDDFNHCTVLKGVDGYHHTEGGHSTNGQHEGYTTIAKMIERVEYNPAFYTRTIGDALTWLENNKVSM